MSGFSDAITSSRYVRLTTFRESGEPVATPVWATWDGDVLTVITQAPSGKVKRLRSNPAVAVAPSDWRGKAKSDDVSGIALIDETPAALVAATQRAKKRFGLEYAISNLVTKVRRDHTPTLVLRIVASTDQQVPEPS